MKMLNEARPYGTVSPPYDVPGCEHAAHYEQDGTLYDVNGYPCIPNAREMVAAAEPAPVAAEVEADPVPATPLVPVVDSPRQKRAAARAATNAKAPSPDPIPAAPPPSNGVIDGVDLAAWGRGQKEYLFAEVRKAMKKGYGTQVTERHDAVDFLIAQRVIGKGEARKDV